MLNYVLLNIDQIYCFEIYDRKQLTILAQHY